MFRALKGYFACLSSTVLLSGLLIIQPIPGEAKTVIAGKDGQVSLKTCDRKSHVSPHAVNAPPAKSDDTTNLIQETCEIPSEKGRGKITEMYFTQGPENKRIFSKETNHYVDINLIVKTAGYKKGDCIHATIHAADGDDIVEGRREIILKGRVNGEGNVYFKEPLRNYTLILMKENPKANAPRESSGASSAPDIFRKKVRALKVKVGV